MVAEVVADAPEAVVVAAGAVAEVVAAVTSAGAACATGVAV